MADDEDYDDNGEDFVICQGCGAVRSMWYLNKPHNCYRNSEGELEEGGTFQ